MDIPEQILPEGFLALPVELQQRIIADGIQIGEKVVSHATQVLIGPPWRLRTEGHINHASGVQIEIEGARYLATAAHVVRAGASRLRNEQHVRFQVGNAIVPLLDRVVYLDDALDLAFVLIEEIECRAIAAACWIPDSWPPSPVVDDEYVAFAGYPRRYVEYDGRGGPILNAIGGILRVDSASDRRLTSVLARSDLILQKGPEIPPQGSELGGMSGGPVFRVKDSSIELVAVIKEDSQEFDAYFFAPLAGVAVERSDRVAV